MIRLFLRIKTYQPAAFFLFLTPHVKEASAQFLEAGVSKDDYMVLEVAHTDILHYLKLGDVALLLREFSVVNRVASPVKFAEYLAAGLPVIITDGVGDCSTLVRRSRLGLVLESCEEVGWDDRSLAEFLSDVAANRGRYRARARIAAERSYTRSHYRHIYRQLFLSE
jgi:glycosyltransferase involved in cell wall biosynthesis